MTVRRKLFLAMAAFIVAMSVLFVMATHAVVRATLEHIHVIDRSEQIEQLTALFIAYDKEHGGVWDQARNDMAAIRGYNYSSDETILLQSDSGETLYKKGDAPFFMALRLGISSEVPLAGGRTAVLHFLDSDVAAFSRIQMGIGGSVFVVLLVSSVVFLLISLLIAGWLAKRITRPLGELLPVIDRLGRGELGIQVARFGKDEYGTVVQAFNRMSLQLGQAEETRRNLVADVSHELRTPLTILRGKLDLIQQNGRSVEPESLLPLQDELLRLSRLIDDLHQLSLAEARKLPLDRKLTDIDGLVRRVADRIADDAEIKNIEIVYVSKIGQPVELAIDAFRITQALLNILVNAMRYTPAGGKVTVIVESGSTPGNDSDGGLRISISDTGPGIEPEHLDRIFDRFYRTDAARNRNNGGMGLGLAIAKGYVEAHDGSIQVFSKPGEGTTFVVTLPLPAMG